MIQMKIEIHECGGKEYVSKLAYEEIKGALEAVTIENNQMARNGNISDQEKAEIRRIRQEHWDLKQEQDVITIYLRNKPVMRRMFAWLKGRAEKEARS